jgi:hypothetical protein
VRPLAVLKRRGAVPVVVERQNAPLGGPDARRKPEPARGEDQQGSPSIRCHKPVSFLTVSEFQPDPELANTVPALREDLPEELRFDDIIRIAQDRVVEQVRPHGFELHGNAFGYAEA